MIARLGRIRVEAENAVRERSSAAPTAASVPAAAPPDEAAPLATDGRSPAGATAAPAEVGAAEPVAAPAGADAAPGAGPPSAGQAALTIPITWQDAVGKTHAGTLAVERVEPIPGRAGDVYVVGRWPTGQGAAWEIPTRGPWGRGTTIKVRWETGPATNQWAAGLFQVESVERSVDGMLVRGLWPQGERGTLLLPPAVFDGRWHAVGGMPAEDEARAQPAMTREA